MGLFSSAVIASTVALSGNVQLDSLIYGAKWESKEISYSFNADPGYYTDWTKTYAVSDKTKSVFRSAFKQWENVANVHFVEKELGEINITKGDVATELSHSRELSKGRTFNAKSWGFSKALAKSTNDSLSMVGDIWVFDDVIDNPSHTSKQVNVKNMGSFHNAMHEIGHSLGLKHPFESGEGSNSVLNNKLDSMVYTIMSYTPGASKQSISGETDGTSSPCSTPMILDILAIQYLYGANMKHNTGDDTYTIGSTNTKSCQTIWDADGNDTIDASNFKYTNSLIDLTPGSASKLSMIILESGRNAGLRSPEHTLGIAHNVIIENAIGGEGNDVIKGNVANNTINGGNGSDVFLVDGRMSSNHLTFERVSVNTIKVTSVSGDTDTLIDMEIVRFSDSNEEINLSEI